MRDCESQLSSRLAHFYPPPTTAGQFNNDIFLLAGRYCPHGAYRAVVAEAEVTGLLLALRCSPRQRLAFPAIDAMYQRCVVDLQPNVRVHPHPSSQK